MLACFNRRNMFDQQILIPSIHFYQMLHIYRNQSLDVHCKSNDWLLYSKHIGMKCVEKICSRNPNKEKPTKELHAQSQQINFGNSLT